MRLALLAPPLVALAALALALDWPMLLDAPILHFLGREVLAGRVPYRDLFDMNLPGAYLLHAATIALFGPGDLGIRLLDLGGVILGTASIFALLGRTGERGALAAAAIFPLAHLAAGPFEAAQRDFLVTALLLCALAVFQEGRIAHVLAAGAVLGLAATIKPQGLLFLLLLLLHAARPAWRMAGALLAGAVLAPGIALGWLAARGGLGAFADILWNYVIGLYSGVHPESRIRWARDTLLAPRFLWLFGLLALGHLLAWRAGRGARRSDHVALSGVLLGLVYYALQGKGWPYHALPALGFLVLAAGLPLVRLLGAERPAAWLPVASLLVAAVHLAFLGQATLRWPAVRMRVGRNAEIALRLRDKVGGERRLQVFDTAQGGAQALLALDARLPSRFLYDFHFYHDTDSLYVTALRAELMAALAAHPPERVLFFEDGWLAPRYARLERFPELKRWLEDGWAVESEGYGYRIYAPKPGRARLPRLAGGC